MCPNIPGRVIGGVQVCPKNYFAMARVVEGLLFGAKYGLTFYMMNGILYVRMKSSLSRKKVKYSTKTHS